MAWTSPLRAVSASITPPTCSSSTSTYTSSYGSSFSPLGPSVSTTRGGDTQSSKPSRRMASTSTPSCSAPRALTSTESASAAEGPWRMAGLERPSLRTRSLIFCAVRCLDSGSLPDKGPLLGLSVILTVGGSMAGAGRGSSLPGPASVCPTVASERPAMATMSPGPASSTGTRLRARKEKSAATRPSSTRAPPASSAASLSPGRTVPAATRPVRRRPRYASWAIMVAERAKGAQGSPPGGGT
mmetsp:Transcript_4089/g.13694  ORF Transcript_4089/g.13694 Transcript_4089/m.13694 type:complete len:242 (-) Transcript_4089:36-761(-)